VGWRGGLCGGLGLRCGGLGRRSGEGRVGFLGVGVVMLVEGEVGGRGLGVRRRLVLVAGAAAGAVRLSRRCRWALMRCRRFVGWCC